MANPRIFIFLFTVLVISIPGAVAPPSSSNTGSTIRYPPPSPPPPRLSPSPPPPSPPPPLTASPPPPSPPSPPPPVASSPPPPSPPSPPPPVASSPPPPSPPSPPPPVASSPPPPSPPLAASTQQVDSPPPPDTAQYNVPGFVVMAVGADGYSTWTTGIAYADIICPYNGQVLFNWTSPYHDVVQMRDSTTFEECDFTESTVLADSTHDSYVFDCDTPGEYFISCSMYEGQHCQNKQKVKIHVTDPETTENLPLRGHMTLASAEALIRDRYYTTDPDYTIERLWCVPSHCPVSAYDWDITSTNATCWAETYNLLGFAHRKMPDPDYEHSEKYYLDALALVPNHCGALGYLTELYVTLNRTEEADDTYLKLCDACGADHSSTIEVNGWYDDIGATPPASECSSTPSSDDTATPTPESSTLSPPPLSPPPPSPSPPPPTKAAIMSTCDSEACLSIASELAVSDIAGLDDTSSAEYQSFTAELLQTTAAALSVNEDSVTITSFEVSSNPETSLRRVMLATSGAVSVELLVVSSLDASEAQTKVEERLPEMNLVETVTSTTATAYTVVSSPPPTSSSTISSDDSAANALEHNMLIALFFIGITSFMGVSN